jgi:hypothetical protein
VTYLSLAKYTNFDNPRVIAKIRRAITAAMAGGECVCVLDDGVVGLTDATRAEIRRDWPSTNVRFSFTHPSATSPVKRHRSPRRPRL